MKGINFLLSTLASGPQYRVQNVSSASASLSLSEEIPNRRMRIRHGGDHAMSSRPKVENISSRFWSISVSEGPGPYFAQIPKRDFFGVLAGDCSGMEAKIGLIACRTTCSGVVPAARAFARSFASSEDVSGCLAICLYVPETPLSGIGIEHVPAHRLGRDSNGSCGGLAKSSSTRPITSVNRSAGQPFFTASATIDSGTRAWHRRSGGV